MVHRAIIPGRPLGRLSLSIKTANYDHSLGLVSTIAARSYLVIFEEPGYSDQPAVATYTDPNTGAQCSGIKVAESSFGWNLGNTSYAFRLSGG